MKLRPNFRSLLLVSTLASAMISGMTGCATSGAGGKVISLQKATDIAPALAATVSGAVIYGHSKDKNAGQYAAAVKVALQEFILSPDLSPARLQAALAALPIKELKTPEAQLIMAPVLVAYKVFADQRLKAGLTDNDGLRILVQAVIDGIQAGLDAIALIPPPTQQASGPSQMMLVPASAPAIYLQTLNRDNLAVPIVTIIRAEN